MNSIFIPNNLENPNILDEEIKAYYSLRPVNASNPDYNFEKQLNKVLTEYMVTIEDQFKSDGLKRSYKSQLKKMIRVDKPSNSKKYSMFLTWRNKQINMCKVDQKDLIIQQLQEENRILKEKLAKYEKQESPPSSSSSPKKDKKKRNKLSKYKVQEVEEVEEVEEVPEVQEEKKERLNEVLTEVKQNELSDEEIIENHFNKVRKYLSCIKPTQCMKEWKEIRKAFDEWHNKEVEIIEESLNDDELEKLRDTSDNLLQQTLQQF